MSYWSPIVGRDFSDVGNQVFQWQRRNDAVAEDNIRRAGAQESAFNNYWDRVAQMEQQAKQDELRMAQINLGNQRQAALDERSAYQWGTELGDRRREFAARQKEAADNLKLRLDAEKTYRTDRANERTANRAYESAARLLDDDPFVELPKTIVSRLDPSDLADIKATQPILQRRAQEDYQVVLASIAPANAALRNRQLQKALEGVKDPEKMAAIKNDPTQWPAATQQDADAVLTDVRGKLGRLADRMEFRNGQFIPTMREPGRKVAPVAVPPPAPAAPTVTGNSNGSYWGQPPTAPVASPQTETAPQVITSESQYNSLPSGALYIDEQGKTRRKK